MSVTLIILIVTVIVSLVALNDRAVFDRLVFAPYVIHARRQWYRFIAHGFVHASVPHLVINMFVLLWSGQAVEQELSALTGSSAGLFLVLYLGGLVLSSIPGYFKHRLDPTYRAVGASGATAAVLFSFILFQPTAQLGIYFIIPMPAWLFGLLYLAYEWYMSRRGRDGIAHDAHYFGALYGIAFTALVDRNAVPHFIQAIFPGL